MSKTLLTIEQAAELLNVSYARAAQLARENVLPTVRLGRQYRVCPEKLAEFIAAGGRPLPGGWRREAA
jgi:excisionase family DNA binding protein